MTMDEGPPMSYREFRASRLWYHITFSNSPMYHLIRVHSREFAVPSFFRLKFELFFSQ